MAADIQIETGALGVFAGDPRVDLNPGPAQGKASQAANGTSMMPEGTAFFAAHRSAIQQVMRQLETIRLGDRTYREGARVLAGLYDSTENAVTVTAGGGRTR